MDDPVSFDYGAWNDELRALFDTIRGLSADERARITYSLGEEPPMLFDDFEDLVSERMWARSLALEEAGRDWRDVLVAAGFEHEDWPERLDDYLGPIETPA